MEQREFKRVVKDNLARLKTLAKKSGLTYDEQQDLVSLVLDRAYRSKAYVGLTKAKAFSYLASRLRFAVQEYRAQEQAKLKHTVSMPEDTDSNTLYFNNTLANPLEECPFCFRETLNQYLACNVCNTICPSYVVLHRGSLEIESVSLTLDVDLLKQTDVHKALESLLPMERKVVEACIMGTESLESFGQIEAINRKTLWRTWVKAREKLKIVLQDYSS